MHPNPGRSSTRRSLAEHVTARTVKDFRARVKVLNRALQLAICCHIPTGNGQEPPEPYPTEKMYFASLRSVPVNPATENLREGGSNREYGLLRKSRSLGAIRSLPAAEGTKTEGNTATGVSSIPGREERSRTRCESAVLPLWGSKATTAVRFSGHDRRSENSEEQRHTSADGGKGEEVVAETSSGIKPTATKREPDCDVKVAGKMRRGSEMASWATCGKSEQSARDYLW